jgi:hypothetical protein
MELKASAMGLKLVGFWTLNHKQKPSSKTWVFLSIMKENWSLLSWADTFVLERTCIKKDKHLTSTHKDRITFVSLQTRSVLLAYLPNVLPKHLFLLLMMASFSWSSSLLRIV